MEYNLKMCIESLKYKFKQIPGKIEKCLGFKARLKWKSVFTLGIYHILGFYWSYFYAFPAKWQTVALASAMYIISGMGITCGAHRLFTHRTYKARLPLKIYLIMCFSSCGQNSIYDWVRDHRLHHKFSDTEADPHNVNRGFLFAHIGWLCMKKNAFVREKGKQIDMSDIESDPVLMFERKYSNLLKVPLCYIAPILMGIYLCGEEWKCAVAWQCFIRVLAILHGEMTVNSLAHMFGYKPYNKAIIPAQNIVVSFLTFGEGWHNYHHVFPYDYKAAEFFDIFNLSTFFIKVWAKIGLAYDLREPTPELVEAVIKRKKKSLEVDIDY